MFETSRDANLDALARANDDIKDNCYLRLADGEPCTVSEWYVCTRATL
jgi:hypothetical protein